LGMIGDVAQRVERLLRMQEAGGSNPPISTRHTFASHLTRAGTDLTIVSKFRVRKDILGTMIYTHLSPVHLESAVERLEA